MGYGELLEAADLAGVEITSIGSLAVNAKIRFYLAVAFITVRQTEPDTTWQDAQKWRLDIVPQDGADKPDDPMNTLEKSIGHSL